MSSILGTWLLQYPDDFHQPPEFPCLKTVLTYRAEYAWLRPGAAGPPPPGTAGATGTPRGRRTSSRTCWGNPSGQRASSSSPACDSAGARAEGRAVGTSQALLPALAFRAGTPVVPDVSVNLQFLILLRGPVRQRRPLCSLLWTQGQAQGLHQLSVRPCAWEVPGHVMIKTRTCTRRHSQNFDVMELAFS